MSSETRPLRIAIGALLFEGNTLSPVVTELQDFQNKYYFSGPELVTRLRGGGVEMSGAIAVLEAEPDVEIVPLFASHGGAGGRVSHDAYDTLREALLAPLRTAGKLDGVYLALHGAMVCQSTDDAEGEILSEVRELVGEVPIAVTCDLHGHITQRMVGLADLIIGYQTYPHVDAKETGERATALLLRTVRKEILPMMAVRKAPMIIPAPNSRTDSDGPMAEFSRWARDLERSGQALAVSYFNTQPWLDLPDVACTAVVITDNQHREGEALALGIVQEYWRRRREFDVPLLPPGVAIKQGLEIPGGPIVLSETADCVGGGGTGDSALVLRALLDAGVEEPACILIVDPETVRAAQAAGVGQTFAARIGNKLDPAYGAPVAAQAKVLRLVDGDFTYVGGILVGAPASMGPSAVLQVGPVQVVVSTWSSYEFGEEQFRAAGVDPWACKFVVVKNPMNFQLAFGKAPARIVLDTPGPCTCNLAGVPWENISRPRWPVDQDFEPSWDGGFR